MFVSADSETDELPAGAGDGSPDSCGAGPVAGAAVEQPVEAPVNYIERFAGVFVPNGPGTNGRRAA